MLVLAAPAGCGSAPLVEYVYQPPEQDGYELPVGMLDGVGIDADRLGRAVDEIEAGKWGNINQHWMSWLVISVLNGVRKAPTLFRVATRRWRRGSLVIPAAYNLHL